MADKKQVVRKVSPAPLADFDEQLWPVSLLLLISAGCLAGYVWLTSDFDTPDLLKNGWFHLGVLGALALTLIVGIAMLRGSSQRRLQLGVFLSLAFHVGLLFVTVIGTPSVFIAGPPRAAARDARRRNRRHDPRLLARAARQ